MTSDPRDAEIAELRNQIAQLRLASVPENQRAAVQTQMELDQRRAELDAERAQLNQAGLKIEAMRLSASTGIAEEKLLEHNSLAGMRDYAIQEVTRTKAEDVARLIRGEAPNPDPNAPGDPATPPSPAPAPGAVADPATTPTGQPGAAPLGADPVEELLKRDDIGRDSGRVEDYLYQLRSNVGWEDVSLDGSVAPAPAAAPPAATPAAPAPDPTPAPAAPAAPATGQPGA